MNQAFKAKSIQQVTRWQVMKLLNWDEQQFANFQFEQGYEYLKFWIGEDVFGYKELPLTASFWAWWRNQWHKRDMDFVLKAKVMSLNDRCAYYQHIHSPEAMKYTPQSAIMDEAFALIKHLIKYDLNEESEASR